MSSEPGVEPLFVLYVADQARSARFWAAALGGAPRLDVPGMTEFALPGGGALGLMPERGILSMQELLEAPGPEFTTPPPE